MNWSGCTDVERKPDVMSGADVVIGTRVPPDAIIAHVRSGYTAEDISTQIFPSVPVSRVRRLIRFVQDHEAHPA